ncbi:MAG TPA: cyclase family protein [Myxococcaceae bacterium]|jgi:kynurenine formamidase
MKKFIELNHILEDGMMPYPGLASPRVSAVVDHATSRPRYKDQAEFYLGRVEMDCNIGTYLDSPFHRYPEAEDLSRVPLERLAALPGLVIQASPSNSRAITLKASEEALRGRAVLVRTDWSERWGTARYYEPGPYLSAESIELLVRAQPALVGVDFWNVDDTQDPVRPAHTRLLKAGILIVEHLCNLAALPEEGFHFYAVPLRIVRGASFPVRAFAELG